MTGSQSAVVFFFFLGQPCVGQREVCVWTVGPDDGRGGTCAFAFGFAVGQGVHGHASESKGKADTATADDMDALLPETVLTKLEEFFLAHAKRNMHTAPSESLVSSLCREVMSNVLTVHSMHKVMLRNIPKPHRKKVVSKHVSLTFEEMRRRHSEPGWLLALRTSGSRRAAHVWPSLCHRWFSWCAVARCMSEHMLRSPLYLQLKYADMILRLPSRAAGDAVQMFMSNGFGVRWQARRVPFF